MTLRGVALLAVALVAAACTSGPAPTQGPSVSPSAEASPSSMWPSFDPGSVAETIAQTLGLACQPVDQRIQCQTVRPSGARFEVVVPDGTIADDRAMSVTASGPIELESEARRLFSAVAGVVTGEPALSREWQDQIWAAFADPSAPTATLPNGVSWSATRQPAGDVFVWRLSLTW